MNMRSPIVAMLWENWRLTRVEAAQRLGFGIVAASAALALFGASASVAFWILLFVHCMFWMSIAKLNGGRFMDGYKPGFPLHLLYMRPVPTVVFVGAAMAYDAMSCAALYLVSATLVGFAFGQPLPLLSVTVWIVTFHLLCLAVQWSTPNRVVQWLGSIAIAWPLVLLLQSNVATPLKVEFSFTENALLVLMGVVSCGVAVAGVRRQRRGDAVATVPRTAGSVGYPDWLVGLFRFQCPTSSATRAQMWFELKSSGLPVLAIGLALAVMIPLVFVITTQIDVVLSEFYARPAIRGVAVVLAMLSLPMVVLVLGSNAFGIRARQGRTYTSAFEATQAYGTARMAGVKVLMRSACLLAALLAVGTSIWTSASVIPFDVLDDHDALIEKSRLPLSGWMRAIRSGVGAMSAHELLALACVTIIGVAVIVAGRATLAALKARYPRRLNIALSLLLLHGFVLVLLGLVAHRQIGLKALADALFGATPWLAATAIVLATVYLFWSGLAERVLTVRYVCGALVISAAFCAACLTVLKVAGVQIVEMPTMNVVSIFSILLLPLMVSVLVPWSLNRIRHL